MSQSTSLVSFEANMRERIKSLVGELIPKEAIDRAVVEAKNEFLIKNVKNIVEEQLTLYYKEKIQNALKSPEWESKWVSFGAQVNAHDVRRADENIPHMDHLGPELQKMLVECAPLMFANIFRGAAIGMIQALRDGKIY